MRTDRKEVQKVWVGVDAGRRALDKRQLPQDDVKLSGLNKVDLRLGLVSPVGQSNMDGYEVLQVHAQDGEAEAGAF